MERAIQRPLLREDNRGKLCSDCQERKARSRGKCRRCHTRHWMREHRAKQRSVEQMSAVAR